MHKFFKFQPFGSSAMTSVTCANGAEPAVLTALVRLLDAVNGFGQFRMFAKLGQGATLEEVRLSARQAEVAALLLGSPGIDQKLAAAMAVVKQEQRAHAAQEEEVQRVHRLDGFDFGKLIETRSAGRLVQRPFQPMCVLSCARLLPVTHFKALARLTTYDKTAKTFSLTAQTDCPVVRDKLLALAAKIAKSTKQVTPADIANRRAELRKKAAARSISWDEIELMVEDVAGYATKENMLNMARELCVSPTGIAPWVTNPSVG